MNPIAPPPSHPSFDEAVARVARAEQAEGWLARCDDAGCYLVLSRELVTSLAAVLRRLEGPVLEVCAGDGSLARALRGRGLDVTATDVRPPEGAGPDVLACPADEALRRHPHRVVLGSFVPIDAGVDARVLAAPHVRHYLVLNARLGLGAGARSLPDRPAGWRAVPLPEVSRWMVTRHDAWLGDHLPILRRGDAWLLSRSSPEE